MLIFITIVMIMVLLTFLIKAIANLFLRRRLLQMFWYQSEKNACEWNCEYVNKLEKVELTAQEIEDLELMEVLRKCDYTWTPIGKEYMYGRMVGEKQDNHMLENLILRLKNQKTLADTLYHLYHLSHEYDRCLGLFDHQNVFSKKDRWVIALLSLLPFLLIIMFFYLREDIFVWIILSLMLLIGASAFYTQRIKTIIEETMSYCYMVDCLDALRKSSLFDEEMKQDIDQVIQEAKKYTCVSRMIYKMSKIDVIYLLELLQSLLLIPIHQYLLLTRHAIQLQKDMIKIFEYVGVADLAVSLLFLRECYETCQPLESSKRQLSFQKAYHPLLKNPIKNDFFLEHSCIITGSNASGKSTFLKMIGVNMVLAKALHTCFAKEWQSYPFHLCTSIHMKDDLCLGDSYYVKEMKTLKRIIEQVRMRTCLVFIDEILKGTNERERVMIAKAILHQLFLSHSLIMVTTHDLSIVKSFDWVAQYCFNDHIQDGQLCCDYKIHEGICQVGNAIALLEIYGFDQEILDMIKKPD